MAFTPASLAVIVQPIGSRGIRFHSYKVDDPVGTVIGEGYFVRAASYGLRVSDLVFVSPSAGSAQTYLLVIESVDAETGAGTAVISGEVLIPQNFGARMDVVADVNGDFVSGTDDTEAFLAFGEYLKNRSEQNGVSVAGVLPTGGAYVTGTAIDWSGCTVMPHLYCPTFEGFFFYHNSFGRHECIINANAGTRSARIGGLVIDNLGVRGNGDIDDPIFVRRDWSRVDEISVRTENNWNSAIKVKEADNSDDFHVEGYASGYQHLHRNVGSVVRFSCTASNATITARDAHDVPLIGFATGHEDDYVHMADADTGITLPGGANALRQIATVPTDGSTFTVDVAPTKTVTSDDAHRLSFGPLLCSTTDGSPNVVLSNEADIVVDDDIIVDGAGPSKGPLHGIVIAVAGVNVTLDVDADETVTDKEVWTRSTVMFSCPKSEPGGDTAQNITNKITVTGRLDSYNGVALMLNDAVNVFVDMRIEAFTNGSANDYARSRAAMFVGRSTVQATGEFAAYSIGGHPTVDHTMNSGNIIVSGGRSVLVVDGMFYFLSDYSFGVDFSSNDNAAAAVVKGNIIANNHTNMLPFVRRRSLGAVLGPQPIYTDDSGGRRDIGGSIRGGEFSGEGHSYPVASGATHVRILTSEAKVGHLTVMVRSGFPDYCYEGWVVLARPLETVPIVAAVHTAQQTGTGVRVLTIAKDAADVLWNEGSSDTKLNVFLSQDGHFVIVNRTLQARTVAITMFGGARLTEVSQVLSAA